VDGRGWKESIPGKIWSKSARDLAFPCAGIFLVITRTLSPFPHSIPSLSLISPGILSCACLVCRQCSVYVYIHANSTTPTHPSKRKQRNLFHAKLTFPLLLLAHIIASSLLPSPSCSLSCLCHGGGGHGDAVPCPGRGRQPPGQEAHREAPQDLLLPR